MNIRFPFPRALFGGALLCASAAVLAQSGTDAAVPPAAAAKQANETAGSDPARWYQDDGSRATRMKILQKELGAALQEAKNACNKGPSSARASCLQTAQATYQRDMANAQAQVDGAPGGSVTTTVTPSTPEPAAPVSR